MKNAPVCFVVLACLAASGCSSKTESSASASARATSAASAAASAKPAAPGDPDEAAIRDTVDKMAAQLAARATKKTYEEMKPIDEAVGQLCDDLGKRAPAILPKLVKAVEAGRSGDAAKHGALLACVLHLKQGSVLGATKSELAAASLPSLKSDNATVVSSVCGILEKETRESHKAEVDAAIARMRELQGKATDEYAKDTFNDAAVLCSL